MIADHRGTTHRTTYSGTTYYQYKPFGGVWSNPVELRDEYWDRRSPIFVDQNNNLHFVWGGGIYSDDFYFTTADSTSTYQAFIQQIVDVPNEMNDPTLAFTHKAFGDVPYDESGLNVLIQSSITNTQVISVESSALWKSDWIDMSPWSGETVSITFMLEQTDDAPLIELFLDNVSLGSTYPDITLKAAGSQSALPGEQVVYYLDYGNIGSIEAENALITLTLPSEVTFITSTISPISIEPLAWAVGDLPANSWPMATIVITTNIKEPNSLGGILNFHFEIVSNSQEIELQNNVVEKDLFIGHLTYLPFISKN